MLPTPFMEFHSGAVPDGTLQVVGMQGRESISSPYEFHLELFSLKGDLDLEQILEAPACLRLLRGEAEGAGRKKASWQPIHGQLLVLEQLDRGAGWVNFRAVLVPRLASLRFSVQSRIFQERSIPEIVTEVLQGDGLKKGQDFDFQATLTHPKKEYLVQYQESDFDFVSRLLEHAGIFYYFEQGDKEEKIVFADNAGAIQPLPEGDTVPYRPPTGMAEFSGSGGGGEAQHDEAVSSLAGRFQAAPGKVVLKDFNYRKPSLELKAEADAVEEGRGTVYEYGGHFKDTAEGKSLAQVRAEEIKCRRQVWSGRGDCRSFRAGFSFQLKEHFRSDWNQRFLLTAVAHHGRQRLATGPQDLGKDADYGNEFTCIPADVVFRPERRTPRPRITGTMPAKIDAAGSGQYAEIDGDGRYRVIVPFDLSGKSGGQASRAIRMAQPYGGGGMGMHFPLHKGTEVILTHVDGDPDRPIIASAVPNPETASLVTGPNQTQCQIKSGGNNYLILEDTQGSEFVNLHAQKDWNTSVGNDKTLQVGHDEMSKVANNRQREVGVDESLKVGSNRLRLVGANEDITVGGDRTLTVAGNETDSMGKNFTHTVGLNSTQTVGVNLALTVGVAMELNVGGVLAETVGGAKAVTVGGPVAVQTGASQTTTVGGDDTLAVSGARSATIGGKRVDKVAGDHTTTVGATASIKAKKIQLTAEEELVITVGDATISLKKSGDIVVKGKKVKVDGSSDVVLKGSKISAN